MPFWEQLGLQAAGTGMGMLLGQYNDARQLRQQQNLQNLQISGNKAMMDYSYQKQLQMWKDTNYAAQIQQLKAAGLNPGLLYGMKGGGGITTGSPAGGIQGANAPTGGQEIPTMIGQGIQLELLRAQKENIQADTALKQTEATKKAGVDTQLALTSIDQLKQQINTQQATEELTRIQTRIERIKAYIQGETIQESIDLVVQTLGKLNQEVMQAEVKTFTDRATQNLVVDTVKAELASILIQNELTKSNIQVNNAQIVKWMQEIAQTWKSLELQGMEVEIHKGQLIVNKGHLTQDQLKTGIQARGVSVEEGRLELEKKIKNITDGTKLTADIITKIIGSILGNKNVQ